MVPSLLFVSFCFVLCRALLRAAAGPKKLALLSGASVRRPFRRASIGRPPAQLGEVSIGPLESGRLGRRAGERAASRTRQRRATKRGQAEPSRAERSGAARSAIKCKFVFVRASLTTGGRLSFRAPRIAEPPLEQRGRSNVNGNDCRRLRLRLRLGRGLGLGRLGGARVAVSARARARAVTRAA